MNGQNDDPSDRTIVRPSAAAGRPLPGSTSSSAAAAPPRAAAPPPPPQPARAPAAQIGEFLGHGRNPLVLAASPLLLLAAQLRTTPSQPDVYLLQQQVVAQIRQFESRAQSAGLTPQVVTAARYALCSMIDEAVLNTPWGEHGGWSAKTLLATFHSENYGGEKFFVILDRLGQDFAKHIDLIELMYLCLALGFAGKYAIEAGGQARLADIQEELYRRIKPIRGLAAEELSPAWRGIEDRRNPLIRYVPLWVIAVAGLALVVGAFLYFFAKLNAESAPLSARLAAVGIESAVPGDTPKPPPPAQTLKQLLSPQEAAGQLVVEEAPTGRSTVRLISAQMFPSGGVIVGDSQRPVLEAVRDALNRVPGRVVVIGHTDDQPIRSLRYKDNYELSAERARAVVAILANGLDNPARLESSGAGPSQPIATPPSTPENRARNRRVEIIHTP